MPLGEIVLGGVGSGSGDPASTCHRADRDRHRRRHSVGPLEYPQSRCARIHEVLYALSSTSNNNGSAFGGLTVDTTFYNQLLAVTMWIGRFGVMILVLVIAGSLAAKKRVPTSAGNLPTHTPLFTGLLIGTVVMVASLTFLPALALGPIVEQLQSVER